MSISKAKKKAKLKRREFRNRIKLEQTQAKERKELKAEINRRFSSGQIKMTLPEDDCYDYKEIFTFEDFSVLEMLAKRMFFVKLEENLQKTECDNTLRFSKSLLLNMGLKNRIDEILNIFEKYGGFCDCEVLYNIRDNMYIQYDEGYENGYLEYDGYIGDFTGRYIY